MRQVCALRRKSTGAFLRCLPASRLWTTQVGEVNIDGSVASVKVDIGLKISDNATNYLFDENAPFWNGPHRAADRLIVRGEYFIGQDVGQLWLDEKIDRDDLEIVSWALSVVAVATTG